MNGNGSSRWLGVGRSPSEDAREAGRQATTQSLRGEDPKLLIVFCSHAYDLDGLVAGINECSGGAPLIGCSTAGEIATGGPGDASVVVVALGGDGFSIGTAAAEAESVGLRDASATVARNAREVELEGRPHRFLLLLTDGLGGDQEEVVRGAYSVLGAGVPLVGGCAGDALEMRKTYQLHGDRVLEGAIVGACVASDAPFGVGVQHGWRKVGDAMLVTRSADNRVYNLNDAPALDVYLERLQAPASAHTDPTAFTRFALTHPLGLDRRSGEEVRFVAEANFEDRSLGCIAQVPQGGLAWMMEGDENSVLSATDAACGDALEALDGHAPLGMLAFDCIARRGVLGEPGIEREVHRVTEHAGGAEVAGFYTYGEIARTRGINGFHNQTLVVLALG